MHGVDRGQFLRLGAVGALAAVTGAVAVPAASAAGPAPAPVDDDLGFVQWAATAELVTVAYWDRALAERGFGEQAQRWMTAMRERRRGPPREARAPCSATARRSDRDFKVVLPKRKLASRAATIAFGEELEEHMLRVLLGAVSQAARSRARGCCSAQILVNDTQHLDSLRQLAGEPSAFAGLRGPLELEPAGDWLDALPPRPLFLDQGDHR